MLVPGRKPIGHVVADHPFFARGSLIHLFRGGLYDSVLGSAWYNAGSGDQILNNQWGIYHGENCKMSRVGAGHTRHGGIPTTKHPHTMFCRTYHPYIIASTTTFVGSSASINGGFRVATRLSYDSRPALTLGGTGGGSWFLDTVVPTGAWLNMAVSYDGVNSANYATFTEKHGLYSAYQSLNNTWNTTDGVFIVGGYDTSAPGLDVFYSLAFYEPRHRSLRELEAIVLDPFQFLVPA